MCRAHLTGVLSPFSLSASPSPCPFPPSPPPPPPPLPQDNDGQIPETHSISAGLDYPGVGPEHSWLKDSGRAEYAAVTDVQALEALQLLARTEGLISALEPSHAVYHAMQVCAVFFFFPLFSPRVFPGCVGVMCVLRIYRCYYLLTYFVCANHVFAYLAVFVRRLLCLRLNNVCETDAARASPPHAKYFPWCRCFPLCFIFLTLVCDWCGRWRRECRRIRSFS